MRFPLAESKIVMLSKSIANGLADNPEKFPTPPAVPAVLEDAITEFTARAYAAMEAQAAAKEATNLKRAAFETLTNLMKSDLRYAEMISNRDDAMLKTLGWSAPREKKAMAAAGQPGLLRAENIGEGKLTLLWNAPTTGGKVLAYRVQRHFKSETAWQEAASALDTAVTLTNQPTGEILEYRVVAMNKGGSGLGSNSVTVKL